MANTFRGKAQVSGSKMVFDVILYPVVESNDLTQHWDENMILDSNGDDFSIKAHNEKWDGDIGMVLVDQSSSSSLANAEAGAVFLNPLASINISQCLIQSWNGLWQLAPGNTLKGQNTGPGKGGLKLRRWADSGQNALMNSVPG